MHGILVVLVWCSEHNSALSIHQIIMFANKLYKSYVKLQALAYLRFLLTFRNRCCRLFAARCRCDKQFDVDIIRQQLVKFIVSVYQLPLSVPDILNVCRFFDRQMNACSVLV